MLAFRHQVWRCFSALVLCYHVTGCSSWQLPRIDPSGERIFLPAGTSGVVTAPMVTHPEVNTTVSDPSVQSMAKPPGISIVPSEVVAPIGSNVVLVAQLCGVQGNLSGNERIEWSISPVGAGKFTSQAKPQSVDPYDRPAYPSGSNQNLVTHSQTSKKAYKINRDILNLSQDISIEPGQSWVAVTAGKSGTSYVTAKASVVGHEDQGLAFARIYWVDAQWMFPAPAIGPTGFQHVLRTTVNRQSDALPIEGWHVHYEISGGVTAEFSPDGTQSLEVETNADGQADVEIFQANPKEGSTNVDVRVIGPGFEESGDGRRLVLGKGSTTITWTSAEERRKITKQDSPLHIRVQGPQHAPIGSHVRFEVVVTNDSDQLISDVLVTDRFDPGLEHLVANSSIEFSMEDIRPGMSRNTFLNFRITQPGRLCHTVEVTANGTLRSQEKFCLVATDSSSKSHPAIQVKKTSSSRTKSVNETVEFFLEIKNSGDVCLTGLHIADTYESALRPETASDGYLVENSQLVWNLEQLDPGKILRLQVNCRCEQSTPRACNRVTVTCDQRPPTADEVCLKIVPASHLSPHNSEGDTPSGTVPGVADLRLSLADLGDPVRCGDQTSYQIVVENKGASADRDLVLSVFFPKEMTPQLGELEVPVRNFRADGQQIVFAPLRYLRPGETVTFLIPFRTNDHGNIEVIAKLSSQGLAQPLSIKEKTDVLASPAP